MEHRNKEIIKKLKGVSPLYPYLRTEEELWYNSPMYCISTIIRFQDKDGDWYKRLLVEFIPVHEIWRIEDVLKIFMILVYKNICLSKLVPSSDWLDDDRNTEKDRLLTIIEDKGEL